MKDSDYQVIFWQFKKVDITGHRSGFSKDNPEYINAIQTVDSQIKRVLETIESRISRDEEDWMIVVTSDHGGGGIGYTDHGDYGRKDRRILLTISGD